MKNNWKEMFSHAKSDLPAGLVVFLVALPLCLGIALASGAPLFSGIITGIVGGIVVGLLSKSNLSVSGPAAGLTVIVLAAINDLGSFQVFLFSVVVAGFIQLFLGLVKAGKVGMFFPSSVIKGMLAAIGLILILKQIPHLVGVDIDAFGEMDFLQRDGDTTFTQLGYALSHVEVGAFVIGMFSLALLILWETTWFSKLPGIKKIPGPLVVVSVGVLINYLLGTTGTGWQLNAAHLVNLPVLSEGESFASLIVFPDFSQWMNPKVYVTAMTLAIVASLETLLCIEAVDKLDPLKRKTPQNSELKAQGIGNIVAGMIGGLPMTSVIVRSSANVASGGRTKLSAVFHGVLLVAAVLVFPMVLNLIPLASLAAVLIIVGYKLAKPALFKLQYKLGRDQFIPFVSTIIAILFTDLLTGTMIGMSIGIFFLLKDHYKTPYEYSEEQSKENGERWINIRLGEQVTFLNKASLQLAFEELPAKSRVVVDGSYSRVIDYDALEIIHNFKNAASGKGIHFVMKDIPDLGKRS